MTHVLTHAATPNESHTQDINRSADRVRFALQCRCGGRSVPGMATSLAVQQKSNTALYLKISGGVLLCLVAIGMLAAQAGGGGSSADKLNKETAFRQLTAANSTLSAINGDSLYSVGLQVCSMLHTNGGNQAGVVLNLQSLDTTGALDTATLSELVADAAASLCWARTAESRPLVPAARRERAGGAEGFGYVVTSGSSVAVGR